MRSLALRTAAYIAAGLGLLAYLWVLVTRFPTSFLLTLVRGLASASAMIGLNAKDKEKRDFASPPT